MIIIIVRHEKSFIRLYYLYQCLTFSEIFLQGFLAKAIFTHNMCTVTVSDLC